MLYVLLSIALALGTGGAAPQSGEAAHDLHVSYGRMAIEGPVAMCQLRFFRHDLEAALQAYHRDPGFRLDVSPRADSMYVRYLNEHFRVEQDGRALGGTIVASGEEEDMWWYTVRYDAATPIRSLTLKHTMLFDVFRDQKNIVKVRHFPGEATYALYFSSGEETQALRFDG